MALGKYFHYALDLVMISMILAGVKKTTGYELSITSLAQTKDSQSFLGKYLQFGEFWFNYLCSYAKTSKSFRFRQIKNTDDLKDAVKNGVANLIDQTSQ